MRITPPSGRMRTRAGLLCLVAGAVLVSIATIRLWHAQQAQREVQAQVATWVIPTGEAVASIPVAAAADNALAAAADNTPAPSAQAAVSLPAQGEPVFRLEIPKILVQNIVVYGSSDTALGKGPGLLERTAFPGQSGNSVVVAHRDYYFWRLNELEPGDTISVSAPGGAWRYTVTGKQVIKETQTEVMDPTDKPTLTLITCWPLIFSGRSPERLVVTALRLPNS